MTAELNPVPSGALVKNAAGRLAVMIVKGTAASYYGGSHGWPLDGGDDDFSWVDTAVEIVKHRADIEDVAVAFRANPQFARHTLTDEFGVTADELSAFAPPLPDEETLAQIDRHGLKDPTDALHRDNP